MPRLFLFEYVICDLFQIFFKATLAQIGMLIITLITLK